MININVYTGSTPEIQTEVLRKIYEEKSKTYKVLTNLKPYNPDDFQIDPTRWEILYLSEIVELLDILDEDNERDLHVGYTLAALICEGDVLILDNFADISRYIEEKMHIIMHNILFPTVTTFKEVHITNLGHNENFISYEYKDKVKYWNI